MRAFLLSLLMAVGVTVSGADAEKFVSAASASEPAFARYLVTLSDTASMEDAAKIAAHYGVRLEPFAREGFKGFMIVATPRKARLLSTDERIVRVEEQRAQSPQATEAAPSAVVADVPARVVANGTGTRNLGIYTYDGSDNVSSIDSDYGVETFSYDALGRVTGAAVAGVASVGQTYTYDRYGNLTTITTAGIAPPRRYAVDPATNRIDLATDAAANVAGTYTPAGNLASLTWKETNQTAAFAYDATNVVAESNVFGEWQVDVYDANDERILTVTAGGERWSIRGLSGEVLRRFVRTTTGGPLHWQEDYVYREGSMLAAFVAGPEKVLHFHLDHLGTPRLITGSGGALVAEHRYYPFGEEIPPRNTYPEPQKFTGHERDSSAMGTTGDVDYMHARYYGPALGRFLSIDPLLDVNAALGRPQMWNRYSYVFNNPLRFLDPSGEIVDLSGLDWIQRLFLLAGLNAFTGDTYDIDENGHLYVVSYGPNTSATASQFVAAAINSTDVYKVEGVYGDPSIIFGQARIDTGVITIDFMDFAQIDHGPFDPRTFNLGSVLIHELVHTHNGIDDDDNGPTSINTGPVVDYVNRMRAERGYELRGPMYDGTSDGRTPPRQVGVPFIIQRRNAFLRALLGNQGQIGARNF